ncbi:hypothetical protein MESS4_790036 [Mesorhizobium sp. STM 4661]|nr:hypothetical protein MESS4_790036 [Mesorhizobium sp. STM 4661]
MAIGRDRTLHPFDRCAQMLKVKFTT